MAKKQYEQVAMPHLEELEDAPTDEMEELADEVADLSDQIRELEEEKKEKTTLLRAYMEEIDDSKSWSVRADDERWFIGYRKPDDTEVLVKEKLVENLAKLKIPAKKVAEIIKKSTIMRPNSPFVQVTRRKEQ